MSSDSFVPSLCDKHSAEFFEQAKSAGACPVCDVASIVNLRVITEALERHRPAYENGIQPASHYKPGDPMLSFYYEIREAIASQSIDTCKECGGSGKKMSGRVYADQANHGAIGPELIPCPNGCKPNSDRDPQ